MKFTKTLCGVTAALTVLSSMAVTAQAEETELKLLTAPLSAVHNAHSLWGYGGGYFAPGAEEDDNSKFIRIGEEELAKWRETGNFTFTDIESDLDTNGLDWYWGNFTDEYIQFVKPDADGNAAERYVVHLDKEKNKITTAYKLGAYWHGTASDGYSLTLSVSGKDMIVTVFDTSGNKTTSTISGKEELTWWAGNIASDGINLGYVALRTDTQPATGDIPYDSATYEIYAIKRDGTPESVYSGNGYGFAFRSVSPNSVMFADVPRVGVALQYKIYSADSKMTYVLGSFIFNGSVGDPGFYSMVPDRMSGKLYGTKAVVGCEIGANDVRYALVDIDIAKPISKQYKSISTNDGKIYLVQTADDKWGYIDSNGKELAIFDNADTFNGDYAPVVQNGKAYLIDRNMNKVSDEISAESVQTLYNGVYNFISNKQGMLVTYTKADELSKPTTSTPTSDPTSTPTSDPTSESSTTQPDDSTNPGTGIALAALPLALIGGAAVVVFRKRK